MPAAPYANHYENFPVASVLLPARLRPAVAAIYAFARSADDLADEGDLPAQERLRLLAGYRTELDRIERGEPTDHPIFQRLTPHIKAYRLPIQPFRDLLDAFVQDVVKDRYADFAELMDYCRRSADPVGRLLLHLFGAATPENLKRSDAICSALQLINHWQDVGIDLGKGPRGRIYLPQDEMARFNVGEDALHRRLASADQPEGRRTPRSGGPEQSEGLGEAQHFRALMKFQVDRARALMLSGAPLGRTLPGRIGLEIRAIVAGGLAILDRIEAVDYDVFSRRPTLGALDWPRIFWNAL